MSFRCVRSQEILSRDLERHQQEDFLRKGRGGSGQSLPPGISASTENSLYCLSTHVICYCCCQDILVLPSPPPPAPQSGEALLDVMAHTAEAPSKHSFPQSDHVHTHIWICHLWILSEAGGSTAPGQNQIKILKTLKVWSKMTRSLLTCPHPLARCLFDAAVLRGPSDPASVCWSAVFQEQLCAHALCSAFFHSAGRLEPPLHAGSQCFSRQLNYCAGWGRNSPQPDFRRH